MTWNQLEINNKPTDLLNIDGYFNHLIAFIRHAVAEKFVREEHKQNLIVKTDANLMLKKLVNFEPKRAERWVDRLKMDLI